MWTEADQKIAESAARELGKLQGKTGPDVLKQLTDLSRHVANKRVEERERSEAHLAICRLTEVIEMDSSAEIIPSLWREAIQMTNAWRGSMK